MPGPTVPALCIRCHSPIVVSGTGVLECEKCASEKQVEEVAQVFYASRAFRNQADAMAWVIQNVPIEEAPYWFVFVVRGKLAEVAKVPFSDDEKKEPVVIELKKGKIKKRPDDDGVQGE